MQGRKREGEKERKKERKKESRKEKKEEGKGEDGRPWLGRWSPELAGVDRRR